MHVNYVNTRHTFPSSEYTSDHTSQHIVRQASDIQSVKNELQYLTDSTTKDPQHIIGSDMDSEKGFASTTSIGTRSQLLANDSVKEWESEIIQHTDSLLSGDSSLSPIPVPNKKHLTSIRKGPAMYSYPNTFSPEKLSLTNVKRGKMQLLKQHQQSLTNLKKK